MLVQLRGRTPTDSVRAETPSDPVEHLLACHGRIRQFVAIAARLARVEEASTDEVADAARSVERFFRNGLPLHAEDEDRSIAPRLLAVVDADVRAAVERMRDEHPAIDESSAELARVCKILVDDPSLHRSIAPSLRALVEELGARLEAHLVAEETLVFPAISALLPPDARAEIAAEMTARRRGLVLPT
jgi:iron-sulfur cluster repair protein YtfE (RIC family)